jgi:thioredoxin reductase (NADPH)
VRIEHQTTGEVVDVCAEGTFVFIGYVPNTESLADQVELNGSGEIIVGQALETSIRGVFAAGDSIAKRYRQITTAVADGTIAALSAIDYLRSSDFAVAPSAQEAPLANTHA